MMSLSRDHKASHDRESSGGSKRDTFENNSTLTNTHNCQTSPEETLDTESDKSYSPITPITAWQASQSISNNRDTSESHHRNQFSWYVSTCDSDTSSIADESFRSIHIRSSDISLSSQLHRAPSLATSPHSPAAPTVTSRLHPYSYTSNNSSPEQIYNTFYSSISTFESPSLESQFRLSQPGSAPLLNAISKMAGEKAIGGWRSRFGKKNNAGEGASTTHGDPLADSMNIDKKVSADNLRSKGSILLGMENEREMAAQQIARQQRMANDVRLGGVGGIPDRGGSRLAPRDGNAARVDRSSSGGSDPGATSVQGRSKLERIMGDQVAGKESGKATHQGNGLESYQANTNSSASSSDVNKPHLDIDETSCPVCLELLSFRLAGEKPHVTPMCGHALHHACFTAVYGPPETILAAQNALGRAPPPGMCGVCRKLIVLGDENESRRQNTYKKYNFDLLCFFARASMPQWMSRHREFILDFLGARSHVQTGEREETVADHTCSTSLPLYSSASPSMSTDMNKLQKTTTNSTLAPSSRSFDGHSPSTPRWQPINRPSTAHTLASASSNWSHHSPTKQTLDDQPNPSPSPFPLPHLKSLASCRDSIAIPNRSRLRPTTPRSIKKFFPRSLRKELAGMMGVSDDGNYQGSPSTMRGNNLDLSLAGDDDPLEASSQPGIRSRDALRERNGYPAGVVASSSASGNQNFASLSLQNGNEDSMSQVTSRSMLYPTIKVRPEYDTIYRKGKESDQNKQNVVCVISVEVPPRRAGSRSEEDEQLWIQKTGQRTLTAIEDDGSDYSHQDFDREEEEGEGKEEEKMLAPLGVEEDFKTATSEEEEEEEGFSFGATPAAIDPEKVDPFANVVDDLRRRITDWKGHTVDRFGPLVLYDFLGVRQENVVREFYVYLFREALLCVTEEKKKEKGLARLIGSDKNGNANHHFEEASKSNGSSGSSGSRHSKPALKLKGRIWLRHIRRCQDTEAEGAACCLSIKLDDESLDQFVLCLKDKGHRELWREKMTELLEQRHKTRGTGDGSSSKKKALQEMPSPTAPLNDVFDEAKMHSINRRQTQTTASTSGHSLQSGKSGSNNLTTSSSSTFASPKAGLQSTSPRVSHPEYANANGKKRIVNHRSTHHSTLPTLPQYQQWSSSGGLDPSLSPPDLLPHTPIDLVIMVSVPSVIGQSSATTSSTTNSSSAALKLRLIRSTLDFVINHLGPNDRIAFVAYNVGLDGLVRRTSLLNTAKTQSKEKLEQFVDSIGRPWEGPGPDPFQEDIDRLGGSSDRTDTITAVNIGFDIVLQRKSKNPVTGMILINDTADAPRRGQMDLVMARAEAANVPVHCFGFGKSHDPSSLWLISNHTRGSYTFVKEWYQLRECVTGCIGSLMSVALTDVKLHISVPSDNHFKVRKVAGPSGAIISSTGKDVDIELGELRFGDCKELFVELELDLHSLMAIMQKGTGRRGSNGTKKIMSDHYEKGSATDDFMQRLGLQGLSISNEEQASPPNSYDQAPLESNFIEEVAVLEVDCGCKDPSMGSSTNRIPSPGVLTLEVDGNSVNPISELSNSSGGLATALADPVVTRRRLEILVSDMVTRCLLLVSKKNHQQALTILLETRRIVDTVLQAIPVDHQQDNQSGRHTSMSMMTMPPHLPLPPSSLSRNSQARKQKEILHRKTALSLFAILEDLDVLIDGLESNQNVSFERAERNFGAQQAMVLRDQKAWTSRTDTEWQFHRSIDNAAPFAALAAAHAISGRAR